MTTEKIKSLLLMNENKKITVTLLAKKMNVSKATMSRMINTFYEQGLTLDKGKCQLSKKGQEYIEKIQEKIKNLTYWLQETSHQEAIKLYTTLNDETIERICSRIHFNKVFDQLGDLVEFSGHYLEHHLEPGKYNFSFTLFHYKDANVHSMANRGFEHPAYLLIEHHQGFLVFQPIEMKKELLKELDFKEYQLVSFLNNQGIFRGKYIIVEDDEKDGILIGEVTGKKAKKYYATRDGRFYIKWASGCITELYPFPKKRGNETIAVIRFNRKERYAKNLIASLFIKEMNKSDFVILKDGNWENISVENLEIISQKEYRSISRKKEQKKVGKFINNQLFKKYSSAWDASKDLCISYQTVIDYCYNAVKDPKHDLRWI